ncbi:hypothetical protein KW797_00405, partial [Candidatus Parcubacteria bacterium]|nr:hypothetical protein [Candidatus Parcubacteria bacterium]
SGTGSASPATVAKGQPVAIQSTVTAKSAASNVVVDLEVFSADNQKKYQQFFDNQTFAANQSKTYNISWTPTTEGNYTTKLAVFNSTWTTNYFWGDVASFSVQGTTPPPTSTSTPPTATSTPPSGGPGGSPPEAVRFCGRPNDNSFNACYYNNQDATDFKLIRTDAAIDFDWGMGSPDASIAPDTFSAIWDGNFTFEEGTYDFAVTADDGVRLRVDGNLIVNQWQDQPATTYHGSVALARGTHAIHVEYYEASGNASMKLSWKNTTGTGTTPPPSSAGTFTGGTASVVPGTAAPNQNVTVATRITNGNTAAQNVLVDMEVYDPSGAKAGQKVFEGQNYAANEAKSYEMPFSGATPGTYTVKFGVFNSTWSQNYLWNDAAATFIVSQSTPSTTTPPAPATLEIWWPTDGGHVAGTQPFKAVVTNRDLSTYSMFWQVDGDRMNEMADSVDGYPHKESLVDLSGWTWKGANAYGLTFTAKDKSGPTLLTKSINIFIP